MATEKSISPPIHIYLISALVCGAILSLRTLSIFTDHSSESFFYFFPILFFAYFLSTYDGRKTIILFIDSFILASLFSLSLIYPLGNDTSQVSSQVLTLIAFFASLALLSVFHREKSLLPKYDVFFQQVWGNIALFICLFVFSIMMSLSILLLINAFNLLGITVVDAFFSNIVVLYFTGSLTGAMGFYLCRRYQKLLFVLRDILVRFTILFFFVLSVIAIIFSFGWLIKGILSSTLLVSQSAYIKSLFWFCFLFLITFNGSFPFYLAKQKESDGAYVYFRFLLLSAPFFGLFLATLMLGAFYSDITALTTSSAYESFFSENTLVTTFIFSLIWLYFALYSLGKLISPHDFFDSWLPTVNLSLAFILIVITLGVTNPISASLFQLKPLEPAAYNAKTKNNMTPENALNETTLTWLNKSDKSKALSFGRRNGKKLYLCQTNFKGSIIVGELQEGEMCYIIFNNQTKAISNYKLLGGKPDILWAANEFSKTYKLIKGSFMKGERTSSAICRTIYQNKIYLGLASEFWRCQISVNKRRVEARGLQLLYGEKQKQ